MYILIHNNTIQVGPRSWIAQAFKDYLLESEDEILIQEAQNIPRTEPTALLSGTNWKILPARIISSPELDPLFEQLAGPYWTIHEDHVTGVYEKVDARLEDSKGALRNIVTSTRQQMEEYGFLYPYNGNYIRFATDIKSRTALQVGIPGLWKVKIVSSESLTELQEDNKPFTASREDTHWLDMTQLLLDEFKTHTQQHIHNCFQYEATLWDTINAKETLNELKNLNLSFSIPIVTPVGE